MIQRVKQEVRIEVNEGVWVRLEDLESLEAGKAADIPQYRSAGSDTPTGRGLTQVWRRGEPNNVEVVVKSGGVGSSSRWGGGAKAGPLEFMPK